jgi:hypothetical protein
MPEWFTMTRWMIAMAGLLVVYGSLHALREKFGARVDRVFWGMALAVVVVGAGWAFGVEIWLAWRAGK